MPHVFAILRPYKPTLYRNLPSLPAVQNGPLFYRNIEIDKNEALHKNKGNFETLMQLSPESREDPSCLDASKIGWETVSLGETTQGLWSESEQLSHINKLEILAVHFALRRFKSHIKEKAC